LKIFPNSAFGYWKIVVDRPLRLQSRLTRKAIQSLSFASGDEAIREEIYDEFGDVLFGDFDLARSALEKRLSEWGKTEDNGSDGDDETEAPKPALSEKRKNKLLDPSTWRRDGRLVEIAEQHQRELGDGLFEDHNAFRDQVDEILGRLDLKLSGNELKVLLRAVSWRVETAPPVIAKVHKLGKVYPDPLHGRYEQMVRSKHSVVEYEPDSELRDTEQVPLLEPGGVEAFFRREVLPHVPDAWIDPDSTKIGYEISFTRYFYQPKPLRTLEEIRADILAVQKEAEGLLDELLQGSAK
jgi:type I restriction enzyme M protein